VSREEELHGAPDIPAGARPHDSRLTTHDSIDPDNFRRLAGRFATGVAIVTTLDAEGLPAGMTANSFASVSLEPPLVSVAIDHAATIFPALLAARGFTVNVLEAQQEALSRRFAEGLPARFDGVGWRRGADDAVVLDGTLAHLRCEKWAEVAAGDHTIFIGRVTGGESAEHGRPLLHYRGGYADWSGEA
jgi:flavin reductase (DIM6/NTAB) family NADH-FMN oxidoreductase RutF